MHIPNHHFILVFIAILATTTPIAARPASPHILNALDRWQTKTLANHHLSHSRSGPAPASTPSLSTYIPPIIPLTPPIPANPLTASRQPKLSPRADPTLASNTNTFTNNSLSTAKTPIHDTTLPERRRDDSDGDNRSRHQRWLPNGDSGRSAAEIEGFLTNPGGMIDIAGEALVAHDAYNRGSGVDRKRGRRGER